MPKQKIVEPLPGPEWVEMPSIVENEVVAAVEPGQDTEKLSDLSEGIEGASASTGSKQDSSSFTAWYRRIAPLIRNRQVRTMAIINFLLSMINLLLFLFVFAFFVWLMLLKIQHKNIWHEDMPCMYQFLPWEQCSATCWKEGAPMPVMRRQIDPKSLVEQRGTEYAPCPSNINENFVQEAPCNVQKCPKKLSSFTDWTHCMHKTPSLRNEDGCYRMRILPTQQIMIKIDTNILTEDCADTDCPKYME